MKYPKRIVLTALAALLAAAPAARAGTYVTDVMLVGGSDSEVTALKNALLPQGWIDSGKDLNCNAGGDFIYLLYRTVENPDDVNEGYVTGFGIYTEGGTAPDELSRDGRAYLLVPFDGGSHFKDLKGDLNSNAGGATIHLYFTRDAFPDDRAVTNIFFSSSSSGAVGKFGETDGYDLNRYAEGDYIYMHALAAPTGHRPLSRLDSCAGGEARISVAGWACDPDAPSLPVSVLVRVFRADGATLVREESFAADRPADGASGDHGFAADLADLLPGTYRVALFALDLTGNGSSQIGATQTVSVAPGPVNVTVGDGSKSSYTLPFYSYKNYSLSKQIYTAEEVGTAGTITAIAFQRDNFSGDPPVSLEGVRVYLAHTEKSEFASNTDSVPVGTNDKVFEGTFHVSSNGWSAIELGTPFDYDGLRNLVVCCLDPTPGTPDVHPFFFAHDNDSTDRAFYYYSTDDWDAAPDVDDLSGYSGGKRTFLRRNDIRFTILPDAHAKPEGLALADCTDDAATLSWGAPATVDAVTGYAWQFKKAADASWSAEVATTDASAALAGLSPETDYDFRVRALYADGASAWSFLHFATATPLPYEFGFENGIERWSRVDIDWDYTGIYNTAKHDGEYGFRFSFFTKEHGPQYLVSPRFPAGEALAVSFWHFAFSSNDASFDLGYSVTDGDPASFVWSETITPTYDKWNRCERTFPAGTRYVAVRFDHWSAENAHVLFLDDFRFEAVSAHGRITGLAAGTLTETTAALSWTAPGDSPAGYACQYRALDAAAWSAETNVAATAVSLGGLAANTAYDFRVRALYADGAGNYATVRFVTEPPVTSLPYADGFEGGLGGWRVANDVFGTGVAFYDVHDVHGGANAFMFQYDNEFDNEPEPQILVSPPFDGDSVMTVTFWYANGTSDNASYRAVFRVGCSSTTRDDEAFTWGPTTRSSHKWQQYAATFPAGTKYVAVKWTGGFWLYLDDFLFAPATAYETWAMENGVGAWNATDALGIHNVFRYAFDNPSGAITNPPLLSISFDASGKPVVLTPPLDLSATGFDLSILAYDALTNAVPSAAWPLSPTGTNAIPASASPSRFFRLKAAER